MALHETLFMSEKIRAVGNNCASHPDIFGDRFSVLTETVQTCVLGQRWRNLWKIAPGLRIVCGGENEPESVKEIQRLIRLELSFIQFNNSFLDSSRCPALEVLEISFSSFSGCNRISLESLKSLTIRSSSFRMRHRTRVYTPNLVSLLLEVGSCRAPLLQRMPSLVNAILELSNSDMDRCFNSDPGDCSDKNCISCYEIDGDAINIVVLQGLSGAEDLVLISDTGSGINNKVEIIGNPDSTGAPAVTSHLKIHFHALANHEACTRSAQGATDPYVRKLAHKAGIGKPENQWVLRPICLSHDAPSTGEAVQSFAIARES
ncbi:hypothetical protein EJB05_50315, partial [Eragrostis curvula]